MKVESGLVRKDLRWPDSSPSSAMIPSTTMLGICAGKGCNFTWAFPAPASHLHHWDMLPYLRRCFWGWIGHCQVLGYLANEEQSMKQRSYPTPRAGQTPSTCTLPSWTSSDVTCLNKENACAPSCPSGHHVLHLIHPGTMCPISSIQALCAPLLHQGTMFPILPIQAPCAPLLHQGTKRYQSQGPQFNFCLTLTLTHSLPTKLRHSPVQHSRAQQIDLLAL